MINYEKLGIILVYAARAANGGFADLHGAIDIMLEKLKQVTK